jgi:SAM-dependent methyltransferase
MIRACVVAITHKYNDLITSGSHVLEIGCGTWSPIKEHCEQIGAIWEGIDVSDTYYGKPTIATRIESVEFLSFPNETFDFVIGNQSLEHWQEFGTRLELGLWQCFRVCKTGGLVLMNVPIHFHGAPLFVKGDLQEITNLFRPFADKVHLEAWRRDSYPLKPVYLIPTRFTNGQSSYVLDIQAVRSVKQPHRPNPYKIRTRLIREIIDHRLNYTIYRVVLRFKNFFSRIAKQMSGNTSLKQSSQ